MFGVPHIYTYSGYIYIYMYMFLDFLFIYIYIYIFMFPARFLTLVEGFIFQMLHGITWMRLNTFRIWPWIDNLTYREHMGIV